MITTKYRKLVRDNIPEVIKKRGKRPIVRVLSDVEYKHFLGKKLLEEVHEYIEDGCVEEFCDILEVLDAIKTSMNFLDADIERVKSEKAIQNGKFEKRLFLEDVIDC